ncbi:MAG: hypothetical protein ACI3T9_05875 [Romboutsia timonensis]
MSRIALMKKGGKWFAKNIPVTRYWKYVVVKVGSPTIKGTVVSGFSANNYLKIPYISSVPSSYESVVKFTTPSSWNTSVNYESLGFSSADFTGCMIFIGTGKSTKYNAGTLNICIGDGSSWTYIVSTNTYTIKNNTTYWVKTIWDGTTWKSYISTDGKIYTQIGNDLTYGFGALLTSEQWLGNTATSSGLNYFTGSIDLSECYIKLNNEIWWDGVKLVESTDYDFTTVENHYYGFKKG